ncbi:MAG TPA: hypothetical protein VFS40_09740 [Gemmatimonadales bacterium]|nr:hypothetical protein [Gemmatimonadales bacterium]
MDGRFGRIVAIGVAISTAGSGILQAQATGTLQVVARVVDTREGETLQEGARAALRHALESGVRASRGEHTPGGESRELRQRPPDPRPAPAGRLLVSTAIVVTGAARRLVVTVTDSAH